MLCEHVYSKTKRSSRYQYKVRCNEEVAPGRRMCSYHDREGIEHGQDRLQPHRDLVDSMVGPPMATLRGLMAELKCL